MFNRADKEVIIYEANAKERDQAIHLLKITEDSTLGAIIYNTSGVIVDGWIRILGHSGVYGKGIIEQNLMNKEGIAKRLEDMLIVAYDVVGGIFALNSGHFTENVGGVWYFAPDTLEWETLEMTYSEFIAWTVQGNTDEFYESMRWNRWRDETAAVKFDEAILIYPFLWSKEIDIEKADKKKVPAEELFEINFEYSEKFGLS